MKLVFENGICEARYLGAQRQVLCSIEMQGPGILLQPQDLYSLCIQVGLLPRHINLAVTNSTQVNLLSGICDGDFTNNP